MHCAGSDTIENAEPARLSPIKQSIDTCMVTRRSYKAEGVAVSPNQNTKRRNDVSREQITKQTQNTRQKDIPINSMLDGSSSTAGCS
jgi:hypothetical protein